MGGTSGSVPAGGAGASSSSGGSFGHSGGSSGGSGGSSVSSGGYAGSNGGASGGDGGSSGSSGSTSNGGSGGQPDCTPSGWKDPGTVANPTTELVPPAAGTTGGIFGASKWDDIADFGYAEDEYLITGTSPAYTSRIVVHRPKDTAKFTGTVFMEWFNVTGGVDIAPLWTLSREYMMRAGHVHVSVSAQAVGANALKTYDSVRYAKINHPGDAAANAIFAQAGMAIRTQSDKLLGPCMPVRGLIAVGQSQSSTELGSYLANAHPKDEMYDGFLLHTDPTGSTPATNPDVPVFAVFTMTESNGKALATQPNVLEWQVAGCTHNDFWLTSRGQVEQGAAAANFMIECANPMNDFPSFWAYDAVLDHLHHWVRDGVKPPSAPAISTMTDQDGNVEGGVRLPDIDVPIATYTRSNTAKTATDLISAFACALSGSVVKLTPDRLMQLYPTHDDYVQKYTQAADKAVAAGYMLPSDRDLGVAQAKKAAIPK